MDLYIYIFSHRQINTPLCVLSLAREGPLEKGMATHSSILAWRIPWTDEPGGVTVHGVAELDTIEVT